MRRFALLLLCLSCLTQSGLADEPMRLREAFVPGYVYRVSNRVEITGKLTLPAEKGQPIKTLEVTGKSAIDYDERILKLDRDQHVEKTIRLFQKMEFQRRIGDQLQQYSLRPEIRRMVLLRHNQTEVPFSPDASLQWNEIDLVRTDVFTPALAGLLPANPVRIGDRYAATTAALHELTDLDKIDEGSLTCTFESITEVAQRKHARIALRGSVRGIGEDGPGQHHLEGFVLFDLESNHLSYFSITGTHSLIDPSGKEMGKVQGHFVLTRQPIATVREISDEGLRAVVLEPTDDNTLLLFDSPELGVKLLYPRRWRVAGINGRQITLDDPRGNGVLITLESAAKVPTSAQFLLEARSWLTQQKATILRTEKPREIQAAPRSVDWFGVEAEMGKQRMWLDYWVVRQAQGGATVAAKLSPDDLQMLQRDVHRIVRSIEIMRPQ
jgi:hypothetical protein